MQLFLPGRIIAQYGSITQILQLYKPFAPRCRAAVRHFFTIHYSLKNKLPPPGYRPAPIHFSLFTLTFFACKAMTCCLVQFSAPSSSSPRRRRGAPRGGGEEEALVQTKMDPCFYKMVSCKVASTAEVWYKPECPLASLSTAAPLGRTAPAAPPALTGELARRSRD